MHHRERVAVQEPHHVPFTLHVELFGRESHLPAFLLPQERGDTDTERTREFHTVALSWHREKDRIQFLRRAVLYNRQLEFRTQAVARSLRRNTVSRLRDRFHRRPVPCAPEQGTQHEQGDNLCSKIQQINLPLVILDAAHIKAVTLIVPWWSLSSIYIP